MKSNSGFSGRGFKFDETEEAMAKERKQIQKAALGLNDSDDDEPNQNVSGLRKLFIGRLHSILQTHNSVILALSVEHVVVKSALKF